MIITMIMMMILMVIRELRTGGEFSVGQIQLMPEMVVVKITVVTVTREVRKEVEGCQQLYIYYSGHTNLILYCMYYIYIYFIERGGCYQERSEWGILIGYVDAQAQRTRPFARLNQGVTRFSSRELHALIAAS